MNKILKLFLTIALVLLIGLTVFNKTYAYDSIDSTNKSQLFIESEEITQKNGLYYSHMIGKFNTNGAMGTNKNINYFNMKTDGVNSKLVTWISGYSNSQMANMKLTSLAADYEKNHPGWIVMAGINADQWYYGTTQANNRGGYFYYKNQTYYPLTVDGQNYYTISPLASTGNGVAITNDPKNPIADATGTFPPDIELQIYDENDQLVKTFSVNGYNQKPDENQTYVWSGYYSSVTLGDYVDRTVKTENDLYIIEKAKLAYMNNTKDYAAAAAGTYNATDSFYGNGIITKISKEATLSKGQFAIETTNEELKALLNTNVKVIVEQLYTSEIANNAESVTGYHTVQVKNGVYQDSTASYNTGTRPRSIFGVKEDGSYFLMTTRDAKKTSTDGTVHTENNALLNYYGAYTAYQDDGGGSVTAIYRNDLGSFDVVSETCDSGGGQRNIASGLFFVVRDPGFTTIKKDSTSTTVTFNKKTGELFDQMKNIKITINNKTQDVKDQTQVVFDGLEPNKKYNAIIEYTIDGVTYTTNLECATKEYDPGISIIPSSEGFIIKKYNNDPVLKTIKVTFDIDDGQKTYIMPDTTTYEIKELFLDTSYLISYVCEVQDTKTYDIYQVKVDAKEYKTLSYYVPYIETFEQTRKTENSIRIKYSIKDQSELIKKIALHINKEEIILTDLSDSYTFKDLDFTKEDYNIQLEIEYEVDELIKTIVSDVLIYPKEEHVHEVVIDQKVDPTCTSSGLTEGSHCKTCNQTITPQQTIEPLGHNWIEATKKNPKTCTICGITEGEKLKGCKKTSLLTIVVLLNLYTGFILLKKRK